MMEDKFRAFMTDLKPVIEKHYPNTDIEWEDYNEEERYALIRANATRK